MIDETARRLAFRASPLLMGFLGTLLEDLQYNERDETVEEDREERDTGTVWNCPDVTFTAARTICDSFWHSAPVWESACSYDQLGSDLYMEMAGHGVGFDDRSHDVDAEISADVAKRLHESVRLIRGCASLETYLGDDGCAYIYGMERGA